MAAGLGFKDFVTGEVLTAADVDGYLMQGVWVFASAAARDAAVTSPQEGNFAYLKDTNVTTYYTGSAWANLDTTGMTNPMTTTGDTIYSSSGSTPARLGIGTTGQVLTVAAGIPSWSTPAGGGGKVLQVVSGTYSTQTVIASTSYSDTGLSLAITPTLNTSKVLVLVTQNSGASKSVDDIGWTTKLLRGATDLQELDNNLGNGDDGHWPNCFSYLDSPATTSSTTYKTQGKCSTTASSASAFYQIGGIMSTIVLLEIGA
jgi:hypothetical protein